MEENGEFATLGRAEPWRGIKGVLKPETWYWAYTKGKPVQISLTDLRTALSRGDIRPDAWVWRRGHRQWIPANRVRALTPYVRGHAREPVSPLIAPEQMEPPSVPSQDDISDDFPRRSTPVPPPARSAPLVRRAPMATLDKEDVLPSAPVHTIVPPGAVPPPPRVRPTTILGELGSWDPTHREPNVLESSSIPPWRAPSPFSTSSLPPTNVPIPSETGSSPFVEPSSAEGAPRLSQGTARESAIVPSSVDTQQNLPSTPKSDKPEHVSQEPPIEVAEPGRHLLRIDRKRIAPLLLLAVIALAVSAVILFARLSDKPQERHATTVADTRPVQATVSCRITRTAQRIAPRVSLSVQPIALEPSDNGKLVLGFAETVTTAAGIVVDPEQLNVEFPYREPQTKKIVSVTPIGKAKPAFVTTREGIELTQARAITNTVHFLFGVTSAGLARQLPGQPPEVVWPESRNTTITDPRISSLFGLGHAITFRRGGMGGDILLGLLTSEGQSQLALEAITSSSKLRGTPTIAISRDPARILVMFAGRGGDNEPWSLHASITPWGKQPSAAVPVVLPEGGPGGDAISPTATSLSSGHWLIQWTEGSTGQRQVRVLLVDSDLRAVGQAHTVSPIGSNSGQGLLWSNGTRAVSVFVVTAGKQSELWATSLTCSP